MTTRDEILAHAEEGSLELKTSLKYALHKGYVHEELEEAVQVFLDLEKGQASMPCFLNSA